MNKSFIIFSQLAPLIDVCLTVCDTVFIIMLCILYESSIVNRNLGEETNDPLICMRR